MNRVMFNHKSGRQELMELRYAKILQGLKRGTYMTRDMRPATEPKPLGDEYDRMDAQALRELAKERGLKVHHKAGADKIREALRDSDKDSDE